MHRYIYIVLCMALICSWNVVPTFDDDKEGYKLGKKIVKGLGSFWKKQSDRAKQQAYKAAQEHIGKIVTREYVQKDIVNPLIPETVEYAAQEAQKYIPELIDTAAAHMWKEARPYAQKAKSYAIGSALALGAAGTGYWLYNRWANAGLPGINKAFKSLDLLITALTEKLKKIYITLLTRKQEKKKLSNEDIATAHYILTQITTISMSLNSLENMFQKLTSTTIEPEIIPKNEKLGRHRLHNS